MMNNTSGVPRSIIRVYGKYEDDLVELKGRLKLFDGLLGMGHPPASDECHDRFSTALAKAVEELAAEPITPEEAEAAVRFICLGYSDDSLPVYAEAMIKAVHGCTLSLIPLLLPTDANEIMSDYENAYPKRERFPTQEKVFLALAAQAGADAEKKGLLGKLFGSKKTSKTE